MIVGGSHHVGDGSFVYPNFTELYDPDTETFSVSDKMDYGLSEPKLALMKDGGVFVVGPDLRIDASMADIYGNNSSIQNTRNVGMSPQNLVFG